MDKITRYLTKQRESGFAQTFAFTTYDVIFDEAKWPDNDKAKAVLKYLQRRFLGGFKGALFSPSQMPELILDVRKVYKSPLCDMAHKSGARGSGKNQHATVQRYLLEKHADCIAVESPVSDGKAEGCIDVLLMQVSPVFKLTIADYKPDAAKEKKAATQLFYYLKGMIAETGLDAKDIDLVYFDEQNCFEAIKPETIK